jgi:hypothetical protein
MCNQAVSLNDDADTPVAVAFCHLCMLRLTDCIAAAAACVREL